MAQKNTNKVRIIAGKWRGRKLSFADVEGLRPTSDRVREALFNWLQQSVVGSVCLDLFSGSGALGFEALSRGAKHVVMVDCAAAVAEQLKTVARTLECENVDIIQTDIAKRWPSFATQFNIVFLDPPFSSDFLSIAFTHLPDCLLPGALIYVEMDKKRELPELPHGWAVEKQKQAGSVAYYLLRAAG